MKINFLPTLGIFVILSALATANWNKCDHSKIEAVTKYSLPQVIIRRCQKDFNYSDQDMILLERELKRFLILGIINDGATFGMYSKDVDNLWHTFILFTKEYAQFCNKFAGKFIHHVPVTEDSVDDKLEMHNEFKKFIKNYESVFHEKAHDIWFLDSCEIV